MMNLTSNDAIDFFMNYKKNVNDVWDINLEHLDSNKCIYFYNFIQLYLNKI